MKKSWNSPEVPLRIDTAETLGRRVLSSKEWKRAQRTSRFTYRVFLESQGKTDISVDRLSLAPSRPVTEIACEVATGRGRTFYGWAGVTAGGAMANGRSVRASPLPDGANPWHADIVLPESVVEQRDEQKRHAQELADISFLPAPRQPA